MDTLIKEETKNPAKVSAPAPSAPVAPSDPRRAEIDELMRIKQRHKFEGNQAPCSSCGVVIENTINRCPFCESDIAPEMALSRETMRRLRELTGELDAEHAKRIRTDDEPQRRGFFARLKYLFEGDPQPDPNALKVDPYAKRVLSNLATGDSFKILAEDGPWVQVKTQGGDIGWVYSTVRERR